MEGKNIELIFRALQKTKENWELFVAGQGELDKAKASCISYGIEEKVHFLGFLDNPYESTEDISFCIVSSNYEGFCLVIPEALSYGIPVISTPVGCAPEIIKPGVNGFLYGIEDENMLVEILDMVSDSKLWIPDAESCINSVKNYDSKIVLEGFYEKLTTIKQQYAERL